MVDMPARGSDPARAGPDEDARADHTSLPARQAQQLDRLADLIAESPHNLVSRGERPTIRERHVAECVALAPLLGARDAQSWIDVGTGGGLPGLVLAVLQPQVAWTLVDATRKKTAAVQAFAEDLELSNVQVVTGRAEVRAHELAYREQFDGAVSRALAGLPTVLELCRGFIHANGVIAAVKGPRWEDEVAASVEARRTLRLGDVDAVAVPGVARPTWLLTVKALGPAPVRYPRRDGLPAAHPLGSPA